MLHPAGLVIKRVVFLDFCVSESQARELTSLRLGITCDGFSAHQLRVCEALGTCSRLTELKVCSHDKHPSERIGCSCDAPVLLNVVRLCALRSPSTTWRQDAAASES